MFKFMCEYFGFGFGLNVCMYENFGLMLDRLKGQGKVRENQPKKPLHQCHLLLH